MSEMYNGAVCEKYSYSQTLFDIEMTIPVSEEVQTGKSVRVAIKKESLTVEVNEGHGNWICLTSGQLLFPVRVANSTWTFQKSNCVQVYLEKRDQRWWHSLLVEEVKF